MATYRDNTNSDSTNGTLVELVDLTYNNRVNTDYNDEESSTIDNYSTSTYENEEKNTKEQLRGSIYRENEITTISEPIKDVDQRYYRQPSSNDIDNRSKSIYLPVKKP